MPSDFSRDRIGDGRDVARVGAWHERGVVQLFVGRGFRDAFARAHEVDATTLQRWVDSVRALPAASSRDSRWTIARASLRVGPEVTMTRRVGGPFSGLRLLVSGEDPIAMPEATARDFLVVLDSAAHVARHCARCVGTSDSGDVARRTSRLPLGPSTSEAPPELVLPAPASQC